MVFDVLRITPEVSLKTPQAVLGSHLDGLIYVTTTSKDAVSVREIWLKFAGYIKISGVTPRANTETTGQGTGQAFGTHYASTSVSVPLARTEFCIRAQATEFAPGTHAVPFTIPVPAEFEGVMLPPSFDSPELHLVASYAVTASLKLAPIVVRKDKRAVAVVAAAPPEPVAQTAAQAAVTVRTWEKDSTRLAPRIRQLLGANTAAREHAVTLNVMLRELTASAAAPARLQDSLRLTVAAADVAKADVANADEANAAAGGEASEASEPAQLVVDCVKIELYTEASVSGTLRLSSRTHYELVNMHKLGFAVDLTAAPEVDISAVLGDARLPATVAPTLALPHTQVHHWLHVRVGLRSRSPDGTKQAVEHAKVKVPATILAVAA